MQDLLKRLYPEWDFLKELSISELALTVMARSTKDRQQRVFKIVDTISLDAHSKQLILQEANLIMKLDHPNILKCYESMVYQDRFAITVTEYADAGDLHKQLARQMTALHADPKAHNLFSTNLVLSILSQCTSALDYIHQKKLIHRDIKPANIMIFSKSAVPIVKIGDFGLSKMLYDKEMTMTSIGTLHYTAPEIMLGNPYDYKCDLWSLGVVLYNMLTFEFPFSDNKSSYLQYYQTVMDGRMKPLPDSTHQIFHKLIDNMLIIDPKQRVSAQVLLKVPAIAKSLTILANSGSSDTKDHIENAK